MPRDPKGRSAMEVGEYLREYERWAGTEEMHRWVACWPDPEGDEQRQAEDYDDE